MRERELVVNGRTLNFKGKFKYRELLDFIRKEVVKKGYSLSEQTREDLVTTDGRKIYLDLRAKKSLTEYSASLVRMRATFDKLTQEETSDIGEVEIVFDGWLISWSEEHWRVKPWTFFIRGIINKYIYSLPFEGSLMGTVGADTGHFHSLIRSFLNVHKESELVKEEDVISQMKEMVEKGE